MKRPSKSLIDRIEEPSEEIYQGEKYAVAIALSESQRKAFREFCNRSNKTIEEMANRACVLQRPNKVPKRSNTYHYPKSNILFRENVYIEIMRRADELGCHMYQYATECIVQMMKGNHARHVC